MTAMSRNALPMILGVTLAAALTPQAKSETQQPAPTATPAPAIAPLPQGGGGGTGQSRCLSKAAIKVTASPTKIQSGQSSHVSWSVSFPADCVGGGAVQIRLNGQDVAKQGSRTVAPKRFTTYTVTVLDKQLGQVAQRSASAQVTVGYPAHVIVDNTTSDPVDVVIGALTSDNPVQVEICNVDLNFIGESQIEVDDNRSLNASPACARGPRSFGPRIFVKDHRGSAPLFVIRGDNVRFSGFRLEGPTNDIAQDDNILERAIQIWPFAAADPIHSVEISNMEISFWSGAGVEVKDNVELAERGRLFNTNVGAVRIHDNYIHHNRHGSGDGYGVNVGNGAYALVERNVFDENRHAITVGTSKHDDSMDYSGYTARDNLILSGGGVHCSLGLCVHHTQQIDVHGDGNRFGTSDNWLCGTAGETIIIERNTVLYTNGLAIKVRGNPADKAVVDGNAFKHGTRSDAISQNGSCGGVGDNITNPIDVRSNNVFGANPMAQLGSCDFFGDGKQDQFMATGVTWWALSPVTRQWRYLNTMPQKLAQLQLEKIDADGICDVAPRGVSPVIPPSLYSKSGTGPWVSILGRDKVN